jgi:hypothetical protein
MARKKWDTAEKVREVVREGQLPFTLYKLSTPYQYGTKRVGFFAIAHVPISGIILTSIWPATEDGEILGYLPLMPTAQSTVKSLFRHLGYKLI